MADTAPTAGWVTSELAAELPNLGVRYVTFDARPVKSGRPVRDRLDAMADRINGGWALHMRQDPVPWAYRVLWRRIGLDPDVDRTPVEQIVLERLQRGGLPSDGMPRDATVIATLETGIPLLALDAQKLSGRIGIRTARSDERVGQTGLRVGQIVYSDERRPIATLTGEVDPSVAVSKKTTRMTLVALMAEGVSEMSVGDALWMAEEILGAAGSVVGVD